MSETKEGFQFAKSCFIIVKSGWDINYAQRNYIKNLKLDKYFIQSAINQFRLDQNGPIILSEKKNKL